jgi:hypothetical protein
VVSEVSFLGRKAVTSAHGLSGYDRNVTPARKYLLRLSSPVIVLAMASVVYLTNSAPAKLTDDLIRAGHRAWECLSVSEALYICEQQWIDAVVIAAEVEDADVVETHLRHFTIRMKPQATAKELIWELSNLFPTKPVRIQ